MNQSHHLRVDARNTRLAWAALDFTHYQVQIATQESAFADNQPLAWDSGKVRGKVCDSEAAAPVPPFVLLDDTVYYWRKRVWDASGVASAWSAPQRIVTSAGPLCANSARLAPAR